MQLDDNVIAVVKKAIRYYKLPISQHTITEGLLSHPHYPTLKSVCDLFDDWKIDHYPMRMDKDELKQAETPFIAHLNDGKEKLAFVPGLNGNGQVEYFDAPGKGKTLKEEDFFSKYSGVSILISPDEQVRGSDDVEKRQADQLHYALPYVGGLALTLCMVYAVLRSEIFLNITITHVGLWITKLAGLSLSLLLIAKDLNLTSRLADTLCSMGKKTDCNSLLRTDAARVFGWMHWSDIGLIYFLSGLLMMVNIRDAGEWGLMALLSFAALGYVVFSLYYQAMVIKTWCPLCLGVQAVLVAEAVLYVADPWSWQLSGWAILKYGSVSLAVSFAMATYKAYVENREKAYRERLSNLKLKRNPEVFRTLLHKGEKSHWNISDEIFTVGKKDAGVEVSAFLSLHCPPCQKAFGELKELIEKGQVKINLIFSWGEKDQTFANQVAQLFGTKQYKAAIELLTTWYNTKPGERVSLVRCRSDENDEDNFEVISHAHRELFKTAKIKGTPTIFVNGYRFPGEYQLKELPHFMDVIIAQ